MTRGLLLLASCNVVTDEVARAVLEGDSGSGTVIFQQIMASDRHYLGDRTILLVEVEGLPPGEHGVHLLAGEACAEPTAHWNPTDDPHGAPDDPRRHSGDIANLVVGDDGRGRLESTGHTDRWTILGEPGQDVVGHALAVHAGPDDFVTQPDGGAGEVLLCGRVEYSD